MSKTAVKFGQDLQATLQVMVVKPSSIGGLQVRVMFRGLRIRLMKFSREDDARGDRLFMRCCEQPDS